mgnify:CR=1 FL=1
MFTKEFVPCIYLYRKNCVKSLQDVSVISEDPVKLAQSYCDAGADELIVFDMSETEYLQSLLGRISYALQIDPNNMDMQQYFNDIKTLMNV